MVDGGCFLPPEKALISHPVLRNPNFIHTDASDTGLCTFLSQVFKGEEHPVLFISRKLSPAKKNYVAVEEKALAN